MVLNKVMFSYFFQMKEVLLRRSQRQRGQYFLFNCLFVVRLFFLFLFVCLFICFFLECFEFLTMHYCQMIKPAGSY